MGVFSRLPTEKNTPYGGIFTHNADEKIPPMGYFCRFFRRKNTPYARFFGEKIPPMELRFSGFRALKLAFHANFMMKSLDFEQN